MEAIKPVSRDAFSVDLKHALIWVARALDYVGVDDLNHNHRVAYIAYQCSQVLGWEKKKQEFCFLSGLIHDCGVSQTTEHSHLISDMQPSESEHHCHVAFKPSSSVSYWLSLPTSFSITIPIGSICSTRQLAHMKRTLRPSFTWRTGWIFYARNI